MIVRNSWANREITQEIRDRFRAVGEANKGKSLSQATRAKISVHSRGETNPNAKVTEIQVALIKGLLTTSRPSVTSVMKIVSAPSLSCSSGIFWQGCGARVTCCSPVRKYPAPATQARTLR